MIWIVDKIPPAAYDKNGIELPAYGIKVRGFETRLFPEAVVAQFILRDDTNN